MLAPLILFLLIIGACNKGIENTRTEASKSLAAGTIPLENVQTFTMEYMSFLNSHRIGIGLNPLIHDEALGLISQTHSMDMASGTVPFGHDGFSARCTQARTLLGGVNLCAENVAKGQKNPKAVFTAWMNSNGHRANIEQGRATHTGFGYKRGQDGSYYWTQIFIELQ